MMRCVLSMLGAVLVSGCTVSPGDLQGPPGPKGPQGPAGAPGPAGTFSGTFAGAVNLSGATSATFPPAASVTFGGLDLFTAAMTGTYPAVVGVSGTSTFAGFSCGAPASLSFDVPPGSQANVANGAFGHAVFTRGGAFELSQYSTGGTTPFAPGNMTCPNICFGPVTFF